MTSITPNAASSALLVKLSARPDFSTISEMPRGAERKQAAYDAVVATAKESQAPFIELAERLKGEGVIQGYELLVSPNMLVVTPKAGKASAVADAFLGASGVKAIYSNSTGAIIKSANQIPSLAPGEKGWGLDVVDEPMTLVAPPADRPFGLDMIGAPDAWAQGADGSGLVYGSIDTGADVTHEAIATRYRGRAEDGTLSHDYNWFDPTGAAKAPKDSQGHGTHTIGTVTGEGVGVAPKAKFISAAGLTGQVDSTLKSLQWMFAPTKIDGTSPNPAMAPDVVGMSWWTGPNNEDLFLESMQDLRAAGIEPVKSAGNKGPGVGTISSPGQFPELIATAAVDANGVVAKFSSRGPAPYPKGSTTPKPDLAAPGVDVISSTPGNKYAKMSGTSMAQPHMSGAILAVLSKYPTLTHDQLVQVFASTAADKGAPGFDAEYGAGIISVSAALAAAEKLTLGAPRGGGRPAPGPVLATA
jgi:hypothetical protein